MKKLAVALFALVLSVSAFAQNSNEVKARPGNGRERFEAAKVAFITNELQLTPEEAQAFWPVYNAAQKESRESHRSMREYKNALRDAINEGKSDSEIRPLLDAWLKARAAQKDPMVEHRKDFVKAIGEAKTAKLYLSEESFRNQAIRSLAGSGQGNVQGRDRKPGEVAEPGPAPERKFRK